MMNIEIINLLIIIAGIILFIEILRHILLMMDKIIKGEVSDFVSQYVTGSSVNGSYRMIRFERD